MFFHAVVKDLKEGLLQASDESFYARAGMNPSFTEYRRHGSSLNLANMFLLKAIDSRMYALASDILPGRVSQDFVDKKMGADLKEFVDLARNYTCSLLEYRRCQELHHRRVGEPRIRVCTYHVKGGCRMSDCKFLHLDKH